MSPSTLTLIIPVYNARAYVSDMLQSLRGQDGLSLISEVIVIDDCSTDGSDQLVRSGWTSDLPPLNLVSFAVNQGERTAVNTAMKMAKTEWILILHADDQAHPFWIKESWNHIQKSGAHVASLGSSWDSFLGDGTIVERGEWVKDSFEVFSGSDSTARDTMMMGGWWHISGCAIRVAAAKAVGFFREDMPQLGDVEFVVRCYRAGWSMGYIRRPLTLYRCHEGSVSSRSFRTCRDLFETMKMMGLHHEVLSLSDVVALQRKLIAQGLRRFAGGIKRFDLLQIRSTLVWFLRAPRLFFPILKALQSS